MHRILNDNEVDILREVGVIGAGNAAGRLEELLRREVDVAVPRATIVPKEGIASYIGDPIETVMGVYARVIGELGGYVVLLLSLQDARNLVELLMRPDSSGRPFTSNNLSAIAVTGSIVFRAYLDAVTRFCGMVAAPGDSSCTADMLGAFINTLLVRTTADVSEALVIETDFSSGGFMSSGHVVFIADCESMDRIVQSMVTQG
jgi:chemotaxis protein CheC